MRKGEINVRPESNDITVLNEFRSACRPRLPQDEAVCDKAFSSIIVGSCYGGGINSWQSRPLTGREILPEINRRIIDDFSKVLPE